MRIGILTYHFGNNYGGILQCYALQQLLIKEGHDVEIINYQPEKLDKWALFLRKIKSVESTTQLVELIFRVLKKERIDQNVLGQRHKLNSVFDEFRAHHLILSRSLTRDTIGAYTNSHYDAIYVGSDQVWTNLFDNDLIYFLGWMPEFKGRRLSYAACSAHNHVFHKKQRMILNSLLQKFETITVRDVTTMQLVEHITGEKPQIIEDPTESYGFEDFIKETPTVPYILTYILGYEISGGHKDAIERIKAKVGDLPVISITITRYANMANVADKIIYTASPIDWLNFIRNASLVYTDSYHAILFSVKFNRPYVAYYKNYIRSSRIFDLKDRRGFENIICDSRDISMLDL